MRLDSKNYYLKYNCQSFNSTCEKICVENGRLFYFNNDGKLDPYFIFKRRYSLKKYLSDLFIERTEMNWKHKDSNGLCD